MASSQLIRESNSIPVRSGRMIGPFPDRYRAWLRADMVGTLSGGTIQTLTFYGNGQHLLGPQSNWTGTYASNAPSGLYNLLSAPTTSGSVAPYGAYRVIRSTSRFQYVPSSSNAIATSVVLWPSTQGSYYTSSQTQYKEQPFAKNILVPATLSTPPRVLSHSMRTAEMFGVSNEAVISEQNYSSSAGSNPPSPWFWQVAINSIDGSTSFSGDWVMDIVYEVEFFSRNQYTSSTV